MEEFVEKMRICDSYYERTEDILKLQSDWERLDFELLFRCSGYRATS
jgi:hypothetical protein